MEEAKQVIVNIVAWNSLSYLPNLFASFRTQDFSDATVTVVDNASDDGTVKWLMEHEPAVTVLRNFRNQGFCRAHNQAIALALSRWPEETWKDRYILVTNPDIEFAPDCLRLLVEKMERDPMCSACGPKLLRAFVKTQGEGRMETERTNIIDSTGLVMKRSRRTIDRGAGEEDHGQYDARTDVFGLSGACTLFRASALADAKLAGEFFDEDFFAYKEDVDLAWRMRRLGKTSVFVPQAVAWHHRTAPSASKGGWLAAWKLRKRKSPLINFLSTRNHAWMLIKNEEWISGFLHAIWIVPYECGKAVVSVFSLSALRGNIAVLGGVGKMWKKRRELRKRARVSGSKMRMWFV